MSAVQYLSPAKINWFLHILGKRHDGYHNLETVFQFLNLHDTLTFTDRDSSEIVINGMAVEAKDNLIYKAAKAIQSYAPNRGVTIDVEKRIPMGAGLGGGSSNAATTLLALNRHWQVGLSRAQLMEIGMGLGADVPVFVHGLGCFAAGIGEQCQTLELEQKWLLLLMPDCQISTKLLFQHSELTTNTPPCRIEALKALGTMDFKASGFRNDFEPLVRKLYTPVARAMDWLELHATANLTGTGCCVFAPFANEQEARTTAQKLPSTIKGIVVQSLHRSPLWSAADN